MSQDAMALHARGFLMAAQRFGLSAPNGGSPGEIPLTMFPQRQEHPTLQPHAPSQCSSGMNTLLGFAAAPGLALEAPSIAPPVLQDARTAPLALEDQSQEKAASPKAQSPQAADAPKKQAAGQTNSLAAKIQAARQVVKESRVEAKA